jgi:transcriptional regulator with XRE-family HTH domain
VKNRLKHFRVAAGLTQAKVARAVNVTQPSYQRWEAGDVDIPKDKLAKLAKVLQATPEALLGRHPPVEAGFYRGPDHLRYYGEVAIHFRSGSKPLLLAISETTYSDLHRDLQGDAKFVSVKDLGNRTVAIRRDAISDVYFSSEAYDDFGPEHETYEEATPLHLPDPRDWEIIEALAMDDYEGLDDFAPEDVERVSKAVMITDEQYTKLVADGHIKPEELEVEKAKNNLLTLRIFELAKGVSYQLTAGPLRRVNYTDCDEQLYDAYENLIDEHDESTVICVPAEGYHRTFFINPNALDYISIPSHVLERGSDEISNELIESLPDDDDKPIKPPRRKRVNLKVVAKGETAANEKKING